VFVCILPEKAILEMTYTVSGRTLNSTHSLTSAFKIIYGSGEDGESQLDGQED